VALVPVLARRLLSMGFVARQVEASDFLVNSTVHVLEGLELRSLCVVVPVKAMRGRESLRNAPNQSTSLRRQPPYPR
jgi:hypothetical protein